MRWTIWRVRMDHGVGQWQAHELPDENLWPIEKFEVVPASYTDSDVERVAGAIRGAIEGRSKLSECYEPMARAALTAFLEVRDG